MTNLCLSGIPCAELSVECLNCNFNYNCVYGATYVSNCSVKDHIDCVVHKIILILIFLTSRIF